jgi:hypothetical protein
MCFWATDPEESRSTTRPLGRRCCASKHSTDPDNERDVRCGRYGPTMERLRIVPIDGCAEERWHVKPANRADYRKQGVLGTGERALQHLALDLQSH